MLLISPVLYIYSILRYLLNMSHFVLTLLCISEKRYFSSTTLTTILFDLRFLLLSINLQIIFTINLIVESVNVTKMRKMLIK